MPNILDGLTFISNQASAYMSPSHFTNKGANNEQGFLFFIILICLLLLTMWLGASVFNTSVVKTFPSVKKVSTLDFFGLYVVIHLLFC